MLRWMRLRRERIEQINAEADALVETLGVAGYSAARRREREASSDAAARHWCHVSLAIARKTGKRVRGLDTATRMEMDAGEPSTPEREPAQKVDLIDELIRIVGEHDTEPRRTKALRFPDRRRRYKSSG